jgi:gluconokinase
MHDAHVLTVDIGSSSVRASLHDRTGTPVEGSAVQHKHALRLSADGGAEIDPKELEDITVDAIDQTMAFADERAVGVDAVAIDTIWHSTLGVDRAGDPTTPVLTWADRRAGPAADELRRRLDEPAVHRRTGCVLHSSYLPAKLLWASQHDPDAFTATVRWLSPGEYLQQRLFGQAWVSTSMASGTGLLDQHRRTWDAEVLDALPVEVGQLSPISDEPASGLAGEWAARWPRLAEIPWFPAAGDGACSNVGCGCTDGGRLALMVGTSGAMRVLWAAEEAEIPPGLWCYRADGRRFLMGGALSDGGNLIAWLRATLRLPAPDEAERALAAMEPDAHGLTVLPLLAGERGPGWADLANGTIAGLSQATIPLEILRASMEAIALRFALIAGIVASALPGERQVIATGGGMHASPVWVQMMADALGTPVTASSVAEASSRGAALLALERLGVIGGLDAVPHPMGRTFTPDPARHERYRHALARQRELYAQVIER